MRLAVILLALSVAAASTMPRHAGAQEAAPREPGWRARYQRPDAVPYPDTNPWSAKKAALGATLFFDPVLSGSRTTACVTCHQPSIAWADHAGNSLGDRHQAMNLRSPTLLDSAWLPLLGWDGKFDSIEDVTARAITSEANMDLPLDEAVERLTANLAYRRRFEGAFGPGPITPDKILQALATYVRGIVSADAPFDRWVAGDEQAVSSEAKRGFALFEGKAGCAGCHSGWAFTDDSFQDIGTASASDLGRGALFPTSVALRYAFKVATLRDVASRPPFMHNGAFASLAEVIDLYDRGGTARPSRSPKIKPLGLAATEKADLIAFLETLTAEPRQVVQPLPPH